MSDRLLRVTIAALGLAGAAIASYLVFERYSGGTVACSFGGCETVQRSRYSEVLGIPVAVLGLTAYLSLVGLTFSRSQTAHAAALAVALTGVIFSAYLVYAQIVLIVLIGAICEWCLASDVVVSAIAALSLLRLRSRRLQAAKS